jgi:hypothetical protein
MMFAFGFLFLFTIGGLILTVRPRTI